MAATKKNRERCASEKEIEQIAEQQRRILGIIVDAMEKKGLRWVQDWAVSFTAPRNPFTGTVYKGRNSMNLALIAAANGWDDPRWVTPKRLMAEARKAKEERGEEWSFKGQKCSLVVKYKQFPIFERDADGALVLDDKGNRKLVGHYMRPMPPIRVLNMAQVAGAPKWEAPAMERMTAGEADRLIDTCVCEVNESLANVGACFIPKRDVINIPDRGFFSDVEAFTSTLAHEYVHATGVKSRLDRKTSGKFGSEGYAFEELVAELGAMLVCSQIGFAYEGTADAVNHAAYVKSWLKHLRSEEGPAALQNAFSLAQEACALIMSRYDEEAGCEGNPEVGHAA